HASPWWVEFGTKPHEIPKQKIGSFMMYENFGQSMIIGYHASHPGSYATHVLRDTVQHNISEIRASQEQYLVEITETIEKANRKVLIEDIEEDD
ncbi:MAG: hypothetical protein IJU73_05340, partial [Ruminococcus sp.]|nr:hypothetical protein [Ruminococcus sp.]